jgi:Tol biopolymer transport system component/imidazolonepropionase-like amidohydrolase
MGRPFLSRALVVLGIASFVTTSALAQSAKPGLPLRSARTLEFTTDEGTWMSVDISPDGRTLVFNLLGHLYTLPITGGEAKQITSGFSFNSQPKFSPDGKKIAFISDGGGAENLWIANVDGSNAVQLSNDDDDEFAAPAWLPDSQMILVSKKGQLPMGAFELWAYHIKGGAGVPVVTLDAYSDRYMNTIGAVASPDGKQLYYTRRHGGPGEFSFVFPLSQIVRRDRATGEEDTITAAVGSAFRPVLSPDGTKLVYGTRFETETALKILDLQTGEERWLKYPVQRDDQETDFDGDILPGYAFTPDGKDLVMSYGGKIHRVNVANGQDQLIPFTAKVSRSMGPLLDFPARVDEGPVQWRIFQGVSQSPDGKRLAFSAATHVYVMDVPGGTPHRLTVGTDREYLPAWSPDGRWIAYVTWSTAGGNIWKVSSDGAGAPVKLTQVPAYYRGAVWSLDGSRIVTLRGPRHWQLAKTDEYGGGDELLDLVWVSAQGGATHLIAPAHGASVPHFVRDQPDRIYLYSEQGLTSMRLDGADRRTHLQIKRKVYFQDRKLDYNFASESARMSPDGRWVVVRTASQLYLIPAPSFGGEPLTVDLTAISGTMPDAMPLATAGDSILPVKKVTSVGADSFAWSQDDATLIWNIGASVFRQSLISLQEGRGTPEEIKVKLEFSRGMPHGTVLLRGAKVITMRGDEVIEDADILIKDNRIANVGKRGSFAVPADTKTFNISGNTVVPGFIDVHEHFFEIRHDVLDPDNNWDFLAELAYGVTSTRDPSTKTSDIFAYADLVDMGDIPGPRAYATGPAITPINNFRSLDQVKGVLSRYQQYYKTRYVKSYEVGNRQQRQWMVQGCNDLKILPTTEGAEDLNMDLTHMIDGFSGNEHSLPITPIYKDVVQLVAQSKVFYTPTLKSLDYFVETTNVHDDPKVRRFIPYDIVFTRTERRNAWYAADQYQFPRRAAEDKKIIAAGGRVAIGSHGSFQGLAYHWEMWSLARGGVSNLEVLRSATLRGAEVLGLAQDLGSIAVGKLADLVILSKDPLQDIRNTNSVRYVMKNGELFSGDTLDEVYPAAKPLPALWWWNDVPSKN